MHREFTDDSLVRCNPIKMDVVTYVVFICRPLIPVSLPACCMLFTLPLHFVTLFTLIQMMSDEAPNNVPQPTTVLQEESPVEPTDGNSNVDNEPDTGNIVFTCMCIMSLIRETTAVVVTTDTCTCA